MVAVLEKPTTIYKKGQTTVPVEVRNALDVHPGDSVTFVVEGDGTVMLRKTDDRRAEDPALGAFLAFLARDLTERPQAVQPLTEGLEARLRELVAGIKVDAEKDVIEGNVGL
jgi:antitoxin PrlF